MSSSFSIVIEGVGYFAWHPEEHCTCITA